MASPTIPLLPVWHPLPDEWSELTRVEGWFGPDEGRLLYRLTAVAHPGRLHRPDRKLGRSTMWLSAKAEAGTRSASSGSILMQTPTRYERLPLALRWRGAGFVRRVLCGMRLRAYDSNMYRFAMRATCLSAAEVDAPLAA